MPFRAAVYVTCNLIDLGTLIAWKQGTSNIISWRGQTAGRVDASTWLVLQAICDHYPDRKLVKKWVSEKIREMAVRTLTGWQIKSEAPEAAGVECAQPDAQPAEEVGKEVGDEVMPEAEAEAAPDPQSGAMLKFLGKVSVSKASYCQGIPSLFEDSWFMPLNLPDKGCQHIWQGFCSRRRCKKTYNKPDSFPH